MIDKREILETASSFSLLPNIVEKDYALGWILAGINAHEELTERWVFKGGTCLKKCYFETYRFSEDLDFTLRDEIQLDKEFLRSMFEEVVAWVTEQSGLNIPLVSSNSIFTTTRVAVLTVRAKSRTAAQYPLLPVVGPRSRLI